MEDPKVKDSFLIREYLALWKESGLGDLDIDTLANVLENQSPGQQPPVSSFTTLEEVSTWLGDCQRCPLCKERKNIVFGSGNASARLLFVGEGPGADEDEQGLPFVGRAGQLLTRIISAMGYDRSQVYIANVVKCRPPNNRAPEPNEAETCSPFLKAQIAVINPSVIVALGLHAARMLTGTSGAISSMRGRFHRLIWNPSIPVMPTYHPAYLLRNPSAKRYVWDDMKTALTQLGQKDEKLSQDH